MKKMFLMLGCLLQLQMQAVHINLNNYVREEFRGANNVEVLNNVETRGTLTDQLDALYPVLSRYIRYGVVYRQYNHARFKCGRNGIVVWRRSGDTRWNLFRPGHGLIRFNRITSALIDILPGKITKVKKGVGDIFGLNDIHHEIRDYEYAYVSCAKLAYDSRLEFSRGFEELSDYIRDYDHNHHGRIMNDYLGTKDSYVERRVNRYKGYRFTTKRGVIGITARTDSDLVVINTIFDQSL